MNQLDLSVDSDTKSEHLDSNGSNKGSLTDFFDQVIAGNETIDLPFEIDENFEM